MAFTLLINPGSSSKKYSLCRDGVVVSQQRFERGANGFELCIEQNGQQQKCEGVSADAFRSALHQVLDLYLRTAVIQNLQDITVVGVRIVAPGTYFQTHRIIDDIFLHKLREREPAAPLHIPHTLAELELIRVELPEANVVSVSDSAFHATLLPPARQYSIDVHDTEQFDIHRFGYHGISVASVVHRYRELRGDLPSRTIVCHVGSGVSMTAVREGVSVDTTMGFGPDSGLIMGTRAGDLDAGALLELMRVKNIRSFDALTYIQTKGGLVGLSGESDFRHILERVAHADAAAEAALTHFVYRFQKQLGAYAAALGGLDAIILTATAAERSPVLRQAVCDNLDWLGVRLDVVVNDQLLGRDGVISANDSRVEVMVVRTQELEEMLRVTKTLSS